MSVSKIDYIIHGWKLPYKIIDKDGLEIEIDQWDYDRLDENGYVFITDGMCCDYTVFGILVLELDDEGDGFDFINIDTNFNDSKLNSRYFQIFGNEPTEEPKTFIFSHYT